MTTTNTITNVTMGSIEKASNVIGWQTVLGDAESGLQEAQNRVRSLKRAIRKIKLKIAIGEEFPINVSTQI